MGEELWSQNWPFIGSGWRSAGVRNRVHLDRKQVGVDTRRCLGIIGTLIP